MAQPTSSSSTPVPQADAIVRTVHPVADRQSRMANVLEAFPDGVVTIDSEWRFSFANQVALGLVGREDLLGRNIFELFPGNLTEPFYSTYKAAMELRIEADFEAFHPAPLNKWLKVTAKPFEDGIVVFFADITARKEAELRELEASQKLVRVLELTSDCVLSLDREWRITFLNRNASRLFDAGGEFPGKTVWQALPALEETPIAPAMRRSMEDRVSGKIEAYYPAPLNAWFCVQTEATEDGIVVFFDDVTERQLHDQVVGAQLDLLTSVQTAARLATWELDSESGAIRFGPGGFEVFGHPAREIEVREAFRSIVLPEYRDLIRTKVAEVAGTGEPVLVEYAVKAKDGRIIWIEARAQLARTAEGKPCVRGISMDITERRLKQQELIASEERYRVLADLNPHAIWMADPEGAIQYANQRALRAIGVQLEELSAGWLEAFAPGDRARVAETWVQSLKTGEDYEVEALLGNAGTGEYRHWKLRATAIRDGEGAVLLWLGVGEDVHESKTYTAALRAEQMESERRRVELESIYATTPVGLALLDPVNFTFLNLNEHEAEMLGGPRSSLIGRPLVEIAPADKVPGLMDLMASVANGRVVKNHLLEGELATRPGERRAWSVNYAPVYNEDGSVRAISTASIEITLQKKAEAALIQSEKLAAVGRLATSISHEINNPLEAITNLMYLIATDDELPEALKVYVHMAQSELGRVSQIATQTLRFHRQAVAPTLISAAELVNAVIRLYTGRLANSHIVVEAKYRTGTRMLCFENDIRQVLNNLIANAIDAMRTGGRLVIRAHESPVPRRGIRITIADTGHGMDKNVLHRIFEPFFTTKDLQGTGLGLWISTGIMERHQGTISVRSSRSATRHGTVFTLFLPLNGVPLPESVSL